MVAIDTNIAIAHFQDKLAMPEGIRREDFAVPAPVMGEMLFGAQNSGRVVANLALYRRFLADFPILIIDALVTEQYAEIRFALKQQGQPIPENDVWIAAICRANNLPLFTLDAHFQRVPGLQLLR